MTSARLIAAAFLSLLVPGAAAPQATVGQASLVTDIGDPGDFPLVHDGRAAPVWYDTADAAVVGIAARDFAADVERVTGVGPEVTAGPEGPSATAVLAGTLGGSRLIDEMVERGRLDVAGLRGEWETFLIATVEDPLPGLSRALVVVGSDRRGTAYGLYELSQQIGVSPWYWWADVPARQHEALYVRAGQVRLGPPSVKYRGIFLNDEDWGLHPWASRTFEPDVGDIGPKTYARIFELLLRLKANTVWPAMHPTTRAFNHYPENPEVAHDYAIVMGSSHAEPMLRNNVDEWTAPGADFNYVTNRDGVLRYWEERVAANGGYENLYTVGMRGVHDSGMQGASSVEESIALLERIFADQREILAEHVDPDPTRVPQAFTPYKEVLPLYRAGLDVPDDITIVWPDDNHGYIRSFPTAEEQGRSGGSGVYYHLSYLGAPMAYLWLYTTPPALVWEEMSKAYDHGARTVWIANVGDLKPAEIGADFFLQMAWDIQRWQRDNLSDYLRDWAVRQFGAEHAGEIAGIMAEYFRLNFQRRPEHLQWWLPGERPRSHPLTDDAVARRLQAFQDLRGRVARLEGRMPARARDAFFELVAYPVGAAALANQRYFYAEAYTRAFDHDLATARTYAARARMADRGLEDLAHLYNEVVADGKWRFFVAEEPADNQWRGFRISPPVLPAEGMAGDILRAAPLVPAGGQGASPDDGPGQERPAGFVERDGVVAMEAEHFTGRENRDGVGWDVIPGLGRTGPGSVAAFPTTAESVDTARPGDAPYLEYRMRVGTPGPVAVRVSLLPTQPLADGRGLRLAVGLDDGPPQLIVVDAPVGSEEWARGVLNGALAGSAEIRIPSAGEHVLRLYMVDAGVVVDRLVLDLSGLEPSYLGPPETGASGGS